jgi:glutaconate CoA-transferase, subunit A
MRSKLATIDEAIALCTPGCSVALGGATMRRKPMTLARALVGAEVRDLTLWTWIGSTDVDLLIGAGRVRTVNSAYVGFGAVGLAQTSRRAFADGSVEFRDWSESSLVASFRAGASGLPVALTRALLGTSLAEEISEEVQLPFTPERLLAVPAARPDVALIHAQSADELGNVRRRQPNRTDDIDHLIAACARRVIVSAERIEPTEEVLARRDETVIPGNYVTAVVHAPNGAHPTGCDGFYDPDLEHLALYAEASRSDEGMREYIARYVAGVSPERYRELVAEGIASR